MRSGVRSEAEIKQFVKEQTDLFTRSVEKEFKDAGYYRVLLSKRAVGDKLFNLVEEYANDPAIEPALVIALYMKAAKFSQINAMLRLGEMCLHGTHQMEVNLKQAYVWYTNAKLHAYRGGEDAYKEVHRHLNNLHEIKSLQIMENFKRLIANANFWLNKGEISVIKEIESILKKYPHKDDDSVLASWCDIWLVADTKLKEWQNLPANEQPHDDVKLVVRAIRDDLPNEIIKLDDRRIKGCADLGLDDPARLSVINEPSEVLSIPNYTPGTLSDRWQHFSRKNHETNAILALENIIGGTDFWIKRGLPVPEIFAEIEKIINGENNKTDEDKLRLIAKRFRDAPSCEDPFVNSLSDVFCSRCASRVYMTATSIDREIQAWLNPDKKITKMLDSLTDIVNSPMWREVEARKEDGGGINKIRALLALNFVPDETQRYTRAAFHELSPEDLWKEIKEIAKNILSPDAKTPSSRMYQAKKIKLDGEVKKLYEAINMSSQHHISALFPVIVELAKKAVPQGRFISSEEQTFGRAGTNERKTNKRSQFGL